MGPDRPAPLGLEPATRLGAAVAAMRGRFAAAGFATPALDARILTEHVLGLDKLTLIVAPERPIGLRASELDRAAVRRLGHEPVARIIGEWEFFGLRLELDRTTLVPRADTETVVDAALRRVGRTALRVLDLGTGSGAILVSLLHALPCASGVGVDIDPAAVLVARRNAARHGLAGRSAFCVGRWGMCLSGRFDLIVANPPYVRSDVLATLAAEVRDHDPRQALDGGQDGLDAHRAIAADLRRLLAGDGLAVIEIGWDQASSAASIYAEEDLDCRALCHDLSGTPRALVLAISSSLAFA